MPADNRYSDADIAAVYRVIYERRDMRHFLPDPIAPEQFKRLLAAAHHAPSVGFMQPWRFVRVRCPALRAQLHQLVEQERLLTAKALQEREDSFMKLKVEGILDCAEVLVAALCGQREQHIFGRRTLPEMDLASVSCAIQNIWLAARAEGLGMGWVSLFAPEALKGLLDMPEDSHPVAVLCLGHVATFYEQPLLQQAGWAERQNLDELIFENYWNTPPVPLNFTIVPPSSALASALQQKIDQKTKPLGALGQLEALALRIGLIQNTLTPTLNKPQIIVFAGDHGLAAAGVSAYPASVTAQMVANFLNGGAAINVFAKQHGLGLWIVDAGVDADLSAYPGLIAAKIARGTRNCLTEAAMSTAECYAALQKGAELVKASYAQGCNCLGLGEMGIGNTASASLLMHRLTGLPLADCVGRGTGLDDGQLRHKMSVLEQVLARHQSVSADSPLEVLAAFGGFEIAMMVGAYLQAAELGMVIMVDGFIASAALLVAAQCYPAVLAYCVFSHVSNERGHQALLTHFNATALLNLDMRLGEGSGVAIAYPILQSAVLFLNTMATFAEAGVNQ